MPNSNMQFIDAVRESYAQYNARGARSPAKLRPLHQWVADKMLEEPGSKFCQSNEILGGKQSGGRLNMLAKHKQYGVVYTPEWIVDLILDRTMPDFRPAMMVCDPACGDGAFLSRVVARICDGVSSKDLRKALQNVVGFDLDSKALKQCKERLDAVLKAKGKRLSIDWNLHCMDSTDHARLQEFSGRFDYVVGNPPYVRIQHLGESRRAQLQQDWSLTQYGSTDLYIAFFEIGMHLLKDGGRLGYITPNTYTKTSAGSPLRRFILERHGIDALIDFGAHQVFQHATTYSLITVLTKNEPRKSVSLYRYDGGRVVNEGELPISRLSNTAYWTLQSEETLCKIDRIRQRGRPLHELADIHVGLQTLADDVYILQKIDEKDGVVHAQDKQGCDVRLESEITRPILKASVMKDGKDAKDRIIIFPYHHGRLIPESDLKRQFPLAYKYLRARKPRLLERDKGRFDARRWHAFGREFGLETTFGDKLITAGISKSPNFQKCPSPEYTFYAGYCVKPKTGVCIDALLSALNSEDMDFYIRHTSRDYQHGWKSYAKSFLRDYGVSIEGGVDPAQTSLHMT